MTKNLKEAISRAEKADALMYAIETCYLSFDILPEERELADRGVSTFYALWDVIRALREDLKNLAGDSRVVDVLRAVREVRQPESTLEIED